MSRKISHLLLAILSGSILAASIIFGLAPTAQALPGIIYVSVSDATCNGQAPCYTNLQAAVQAASPGTEIRIARGTYTDPNTAGRGYLVGITQTIQLSGGYDLAFHYPPDPGCNPTILDAQGLGRVMWISGDIEPEISGLDLTGGDARLLGGGIPGGYDAGGGLFVEDATVMLQQLEVYANTALFGGGIYLKESPTQLKDSVIHHNTTIVTTTATQGAAGAGLYIYHSPVSIQNCQILDNHAQISGSAQWSHGGGIYSLSSDVVLRENRVAGNSAVQPGGGLLFASGSAQLYHNQISDNTSIYHNAGGIELSNGVFTLTYNTITGNTARYYGGGLMVTSGSQVYLSHNTFQDNTSTNRHGGGLLLRMSAVTLVNNIILENSANNKGSGIYVEGAQVNGWHNTLNSNTGGEGIGLYVTYYQYGTNPTRYPGTATFTNTILVSHTLGLSVTQDAAASLNGVLWFHTPITSQHDLTATLNVANQIAGDPLFEADGYHLLPSSPAIDQGIPPGSPLYAPRGYWDDIDWQTRSLVPDLGADEYWPANVLRKLYLPLGRR